MYWLQTIPTHDCQFSIKMQQVIAIPNYDLRIESTTVTHTGDHYTREKGQFNPHELGLDSCHSGHLFILRVNSPI